MTPRWLRINQASAYSGLSPNTLRKYADEGLIRAVWTAGGEKGKGHRRFDRGSIDDFFNSQDNDAFAIIESLKL